MRAAALVLAFASVASAALRGQVPVDVTVPERELAPSKNLTAEILNTTLTWVGAVTSGKDSAPKDTAALYAKDASFWPTVSTELRVEPGEVLDYFDWFAKLPNLKVVEGSYKPFVTVYDDDFASNSGYIKLSMDDASAPDGKKIVNARYTFIYRKNEKNGKWEIIEHHNSAMPTPPAALKKGYAFPGPQ